MKSGINAIIFDMNGVLQLGGNAKKAIRGHHTIGVHKNIAEKLKISVDQWFDAIDSTYARSIEGLISEEEMIKAMSENLKVSRRKFKRIVVSAHKKHFKKNKQLFKQAFALKKQGYKIAILSDQWPLSKKALMPKKYTKRFDEVVISCDVKMRKPNPKIYRLILKKLKLPAKNCIFIDNQKWNLVPAKKMGMKTILFENNKQVAKEIVGHLANFPKII